MEKRFTKLYLFMIFAILLAVFAGTIGFLQLLYSRSNKIRNVILISIDTCRADHLSCYGYPRQTTPNIDAFAAQAALFENTIAPVPITLPAHCSMLTGTIPPYHGVHDNGEYQLDRSNVTLAKILKQSGFTTGAIISSLVLDSAFGIDQGFDTYNDQFENERKTEGDSSERIGEETSRFAINWLQQHKKEKFFLFLHYFDPHAAYIPPEPFASKYAQNPYAGEIAYTDHCIGLVLNKLKELQLYDSTLIIITGDHGEMRHEHGESTHSYFIYQSAIKVPLIFRLPGQYESKKITDFVGLVDITPTICSLLKIKMPSEVHGIDLSDYIKGNKPKLKDRHIFSESLTPTLYNASSLLGVVTEKWKYIQTTRPELYDLVKDPHETSNLINQQPQRGRILRDRLKQILERAVRKDQVNSKMELDDARRKQLQSLGYVTGAIIEDFSFEQTKDDPKDLVDFHELNLRVPALIFQEKYEQAKVLAQKLAQQRPDCQLGYGHLAKIATKQKDYSTTALYLKKILQLKPNDVTILNNMGMALQSLNRFEEAISYYRTALQISPNHAGVHNNLGYTLVAQNKLDEALNHFIKAIELNPNSALAHYRLAELFLYQNKLAGAVTHYTEVLRIKPKNVKAHLRLGLALTRQEKTNQAIAHYKTAIQLKPNSVQAYADLGMLLFRMGELDGAVSHLRQAVLKKTDFVNALTNLAWLISSHPEKEFHDPPEAVRLAEKACKLTAYQMPEVMDTLAMAYAAVGNFPQAIETAENAARLAENADNKPLAEQINTRLQLYKDHKPYRQP